MRDVLGGFKLKKVMSWEKMQEVVEVSRSAYLCATCYTAGSVLIWLS
jgi:hypothetical protein